MKGNTMLKHLLTTFYRGHGMALLIDPDTHHYAVDIAKEGERGNLARFTGYTMPADALSKARRHVDDILTGPITEPSKLRIRDLLPGQVFEYGGGTYTLLHVVDLIGEKYFILESHLNGNVFESRVSPDLEVTPVRSLSGS